MMHSAGRYCRLFVVIWCCLLVGTPALAQTRQSKTAIAGEVLVLDGYTRTDANCNAINPPEVVIEKPPEHGIVCLRYGEMMLRVVAENNLAHCLGRKVRGPYVIYLPRETYVGPDQVLYTVRFPTVQHRAAFDFRVVQGPPAWLTGKKRDSSIDQTPQSPGPMPLCSPLLS